ncbi:MAG TPA: GerMN domain-containing protein [Syntrophorhabdaceae bacterium]|nr:GerMN domain-containing protein [Syntrophorhabdaceae bacterium]HQM82624.1 GerMN domain-containing protein [Syntrophorhabdaceae bacterium]
MKKKASPTLQYTKQEPPQKPVRTVFIILLATVVTIAVLITGYRMKVAMEPQVPLAVSDTQIVSIFFPSQDKVIEKRLDVRSNISNQEKAEMIINKLKQEKYLPQGLMLYEAATDTDGIMYVNVSRDLVDSRPSTMKEILTVYSIVHSFLATFKEAQKILLLVDGQPLYTVGGTLYTYKPIEFNPDLLED